MEKDRDERAELPTEPQKSDIARQEEAILKFWQANKIFEKSLAKKASAGEFVFYDGPPFATGLPHYGHILAGTMKDVIPRFQTMRGKHVARRWGWDCHGLPMENIVEAELGLKTKKDIEDLGIGKFNETARGMVLRYAADWKKIIPRLGRFVDMDNDYRTMDWTYTESIWWIFKTLYDKGLIYEGYKAMHLCPRCETTLSNFEVNQGYKDIVDLSVTVEFELVDKPNTYVLAWTTTPWTLPGNVALAINPAIEYVEVKGEVVGNIYIVARSRAEAVFGVTYEIIRTVPAKELLGQSYKPVFDYYTNDASLKNKANGWKIYAADFVTTAEGTGIVHIAPVFGEDDLRLGQEKNLPFIQHVGTDGKFKPEVKDFAGEPVKPKDDPSRLGRAEADHQKADVEIIKNLAHRGLLFAKEKITHSYPHCWRCDTPLLNYAASSWFVKVTDIKDKLVAANKKITWVPEHIKEGRFGNWLEGARDWAISRSRFWGAPLPVWRCADCKEIKVVGAVSQLKTKGTSGNHFWLMRHGESESNTQGIVSGLVANPHHLTALGREQVKQAARNLPAKKIDLVIVSPLLRTRETAEIIAQELGLPAKKVVTDERFQEVQTGEFNLKPIDAYRDYFKNTVEKFFKTPPGGENLSAMKRRVTGALIDLDQKYSGKNILIITHEYVIWLLTAGAEGLSAKEAAALKDARADSDFIKTGEVRELSLESFPHNPDYELDLHRPYIDEVKFTCACGGKMSRLSDVFDCWFESGAMPYGQAHYLGKPLPDFDPKQGIGFPANFIAEGLDQTRGWFYSLLVLGVALFSKSPYNSVIVNGLVLAEDGQKMSKKLKNYPDPLELVDKYGADALRFYLMNSPVVRAEDLNFSEKGVAEVYKKIILRLVNTVALYKMYAIEDLPAKKDSANVLDQWIVARLDQLAGEVTEGLDHYELDRATRPLDLFVDDLSTWYIRRSRERFKGEDLTNKQAAFSTTKYILLELSKLLAPIMPFLAEYIYREVAGPKESVHLENWSEVGKTSFFSKLFGQKPAKVVVDMALVRQVVSFGLEARAGAKIKVRQPLASLKIKNNLATEYLTLIADEVNVKEVLVDESLAEEINLDTTITPELAEEGRFRDLLREVQDLRKKAGLNPADRIKLLAGREHYDLAIKFKEDLLRIAGVVEIILDTDADLRVEKV